MRKVIYIFIPLLSFLCLQSQVENGLVARYTFNKGNGEDELGKNHAKVYGVSLTEDRFGNRGMAYYFQGSDDAFINLGTSKTLKPEKGTISVWVNPHSTWLKGKGVGTSPIMYTRVDTSESCNLAYYIGIDLNTLKLNGSLSNSCLNVFTAYSHKKVSFSRWQQVALAYDSDSAFFYVNGELQYRLAKKFRSDFLKGDSVIIGILDTPTNLRFFLGDIDDIQIFNRVLSPEEVLKLYEAPNPNRFKEIVKIIGFILLIISGVVLIIWLIKWRINKLLQIEKEKNELKNHSFELENKVLAAQMDPHFIFNSLNAIQQFIISNENEKAQIYLSKFSRLIRKLLETNTKDSITLNAEIEILQRYLEIESLRFNQIFNYDIVIKEGIDVNKIKIPIFLIQPLIENAIWHGLLPKNGDKSLSILFEVLNDKTLLCIIDDNGIGLKKSRAKKVINKDKSLALSFIEQRLQLMSKLNKSDYGLLIIDKQSDSGESLGTKATLTIPILIN